MKECELIKGGHTFRLLAVGELTVLSKHPLTYKDRQFPNLASKLRHPSIADLNFVHF